MSEMIATEIFERRDRLEGEAASLLGHMLFEFSRLDIALSTCLATGDSGKRLQQQNKALASMTFKDKLDELLKQVQAKLPTGSKRHRAYAVWIDRAQAIRKQRNDFVHGRWGIETERNLVVNIVGLPTSDEQQAVEYEIDELAAVNNEIRSLQTDLNRLREHWRL